jgi:phospholipid/cholesterol/gamma-HCH transport system permease protein
MNGFAANPLALIGHVFLSFLAQTGRLTQFIVASVAQLFSPPVFVGLVLRQMVLIGYNSLPVVGLTAFFTGGVLVLQITTGNRLTADSFVPQVVVLAITRELGPVLAGLMVAGRCSAAIAAEIGTMRVTEQIDALVTLSTSPFKYLMLPRILASVISLPLLVGIGDSIGVFGGYLVATQERHLNSGAYLKSTIDFMKASDVTSGLWKAAVFGFIIAIMGCYNGYYSRGGAQGVGRATTNAVVSASILILAANYLLTSVLFAD